MSLFRIDASIMPATSQSRALADLVEAEWSAEHPDSIVTRRDLGTQPLPATTWRDVVTSGGLQDADLSPAQREARALATTVADELIDADALLLAIPLYNWGVAAHVKSWYDVAYTDPRISGGALKASPPCWPPSSAATTTRARPRKAGTTPPRGCAASSKRSGVPICSSCSASSPWSESTPAMDQFIEQAAEIKAAAEQLAAEHGRALAAKRHAPAL
ncbi:MAG: NAD(P)H-dependent oxidoreductase [Galbitalea sp.]